MHTEPRDPVLKTLTALGTHADLLSRIYDELSIPAADIREDVRTELEECAIITSVDGKCRLTPEIRRVIREGIARMNEAADAE